MPARLSRKPKAGRTKARRTRTYASLKREADKAFSAWIRQKDADGQGMAVCVTCGNVAPWQAMQAGHFISRVHLSTRWDETNVAVQDAACNILRRGNPGEFALYLTRKYGPNIIAELVEKKRRSVKYSRGDLETLISEYQVKLAALRSGSPRL